MRNARGDFLISMALANSISAAFARAGVYGDDGPPAGRYALREALKIELQQAAARYVASTPSDEEHIEVIRGIADDLSRRFRYSLRDGRLRFGVTQKALNLFLKYLWCMDQIAEPPHCPFDRTVLEAAPALDHSRPHRPWTQMDDEEEYRRWVRAARAAANGTSLPEWELGVWAATNP